MWVFENVTCLCKYCSNLIKILAVEGSLPFPFLPPMIPQMFLKYILHNLYLHLLQLKSLEVVKFL